MHKDFPGLRNVTFLDSASSTQKPACVINELADFYRDHYANIHRGFYQRSLQATQRFEDVRTQVAEFLHAKKREEVVFTKGTTESINLVAHSYGRKFLKPGDEVIISILEHHANFVPWQQLCFEKDAKLIVVPCDENGRFDMAFFERSLSPRTKIVACVHVSNAIGVALPVKEIIEKSHHVGAKVLVDAAQSILHMPVNVQELDADFLVFSAHKLYGPNGVGILYGKYELLDQMSPYQMGGEMITNVSIKQTHFQPPPLRFEAGTPAIAEVIAFGKALTYFQQYTIDDIQTHEQNLLAKIKDRLTSYKDIRLITPHTHGLVSFVHKKAHTSDIGMIFDKCGLAIRTGHHCAQPLMKHLGLEATARISVALYNTEEDIEHLDAGLEKVSRMFGGS